MKLKDRIYGEFETSLPVAEEIIACPFFERLKRVSQFGVPDEFYYRNNFSRYEHSIGVMILLAGLGASEEEQVAGLLHDVSHPAFSHVMDWVVGDGGEEKYQDEQHHRVLMNSKIKDILEKNGFDPERIANHGNFPLLEREIPDLCADRIDYAFRELPTDIIKKCLENITTKKNKIIFKNESSAYLFGINYLHLQEKHWGGFEAPVRYRMFADALKIALKDKIISEEDFWDEENKIIRKLKNSKNPEINKILSILRNKSLAHLPAGEIVVHKKFRYVDPEFPNKDGVLLRLTETNPEFRNAIEKARKRNAQGERIPIF